VLALFVSVVWFAYQDMMPGGDEHLRCAGRGGPLKRSRASAAVRRRERGVGVVQALNEPDARFGSNA
jgi:hypothetical protein